MALIVLMVVVVVRRGFWAVHTILTYLHTRHLNRYQFRYTLDKDSLSLLERHVGFYKLLSISEKKLFARRVKRFMITKEYIPRGENMAITREMKVLIAAAAIQLTYGYPHIYFNHFYRILVYPDAYYSTITRKYHKGEVNPNGLIVLSWSNIVAGYVTDNDGRNLALHEMAHALMLEDQIFNGEYNYIDQELIDAWDKLSLLEMDALRTQENTFLRKYAATDPHELFAVAVEAFFEQPEGLHAYSAALYSLIAAILKVDMLRLKENS